jgi:hypothetical protein
MTLIPDCLRQILLTIEEKGTNDNYLDLTDFEYAEYNADMIYYNLLLLLDADYIKAELQDFGESEYLVLVDRMTIEGHKYLDNIRDEAVWEETKKKIQSYFKSVSIPIISAVAGKIIGDRLGL